MVVLFVGREKSIKALQEAMKSDKSIILHNSKTLRLMILQAKIYINMVVWVSLQLLKLPDGTVKVLVEGEKELRSLNITMKLLIF